MGTGESSIQTDRKRLGNLNPIVDHSNKVCNVLRMSKEVQYMANFTKKAIKEAFITLLEDQPFSDIRVKDIVEKCGINRNTFYYHYRDIPALIEEIVKEEAEQILLKYPSVSTIVECFDALIEFATHRKRAIMHIYRSVNREVFERHLMSVSEYFVSAYVNTALAGDNIEEADKRLAIDYYKCVCFGLVLNWLNTGMANENALKIRRIFLLKKDWAKEFEAILQGQE